MDEIDLDYEIEESSLESSIEEDVEAIVSEFASLEEPLNIPEDFLQEIMQEQGDGFQDKLNEFIDTGQIVVEEMALDEELDKPKVLVRDKDVMWEEDNFVGLDSLEEPLFIPSGLLQEMEEEYGEDFESRLDALVEQGDVVVEAIQKEYGDLPECEILEETNDIDIDYEEILEEIEYESLIQGFEHVDIEEDEGLLYSTLENFEEENWEGKEIEEQKESLSQLSEYLVDIIGLEDPPKIEYYNNEKEGDFGGFVSSTNTLRINEYMLYNSNEAADTIAHELWHAYQHECALSPSNARQYQYQYNFENYITPELGQEAYENQLVEAEARAFASQIKERIKSQKSKFKRKEEM